jgi:hypothetical protein
MYTERPVLKRNAKASPYCIFAFLLVRGRLGALQLALLFTPYLLYYAAAAAAAAVQPFNTLLHITPLTPSPFLPSIRKSINNKQQQKTKQ